MNIQTTKDEPRVQYSNVYDENSQHHHKHRHKSENLTDSETDHGSPVKKNKHFFHEAQLFRSDFEAAFNGQQESKVRNSFNIANELHNKASQEIGGKIHNEETLASKSQKRTHDEVEKSTFLSSGGIDGYKLMVIFLLFIIIGTIILS